MPTILGLHKPQCSCSKMLPRPVRQAAQKIGRTSSHKTGSSRGRRLTASSNDGQIGSTVGMTTIETGRASAAPEATANAAPSKEALLARIAKAKAYKQGTPSSTSSNTNPISTADVATSSTSSASSTGSSSSDDRSSITEEQAETMRQQYMERLRQQQAELSSQGRQYNSYIQQVFSTSQNPTSYALDKVDQQDPDSPARSGPARPDFYTNPEAPGVLKLWASAPKRAGTGSADEAADWLKGVLQETAGNRHTINPDMRPEEFTAAKEAAIRQQGAEIITAFPEDFAEQRTTSSEQTETASSSNTDSQNASALGANAAISTGTAPSTATSSKGEGSKYKPKVTTWGVFPRPQDISQAFGGGRNIRPGQALETPEQKAKREAEYMAALQRYKKATHTDALTDAELREAQQTFDAGMKLFKQGTIARALVMFDQVRTKVPLKSKLGGLATLQAAVCYDTLGKGKQAEALYNSIKGHPTAEVSRKARQLVFGFQAMTFLKTQDLSYAVKKEDYLKYFRRAADRNRMYVASEEELAADQAEAKKAAVLALGVVLGPVLFMGALIVGARL